MNYHTRIRWWRERCGLSQRELGDRVDMAQYTISKIESGVTGVSTEKLERIVIKGLKITMPEFWKQIPARGAA